MRKLFEIGGVITAVVLVAFGVAAIAMGFSGGNTVNSNLKAEQITGSSDMTPALIKSEAQQAGLKNITFPTCTVAGKAVTNGSTARCFAQYMRIHALEATGGYVYAQMGQFLALPNTPKSELMPDGSTSNKVYAQLDPKTKQPVANGARNVWVTETALTTALNVSFMAARLALFGIVVGFALLLAGLGFGILAIGGALRYPEHILNFKFGKAKAKAKGKAAPHTAVPSV